ncbi:YwmB family TATA-box binding protein [Halobacillus shinanisalinarum]|uniref:YwmB family TATA-box binding protein n=1 Tax=Halobacillus shinanisalinarum TaxID=2932258 RepID=A0ABY4H3A8_9BACI|nr:YwmB family TATA-box binding protein [Halobacillus shinanisalinarum]UOQ94948.1 YwmB family TATA-box binding protein [Halobacillus shinanisalinarum]
MKILMTCLLSLTILAGVHPQETAKGHIDLSPLLELEAFAEDEQLDIREYKIVLKESIKTANVEEMKQQINEYLPHANVIEEDSNLARKFIFTNGQKNSNFTETFTVIVPKDKTVSSDVVYSLTAGGTQGLAQQQIKQQINELKSRIFSKDVTLYTCLKAEAGGIIDDVLIYQKFKKALNITTIEAATEESWTSRSGYTPRWSQAIPLPNGAMNVQFATRTLGGRTTITIGTPIITAEY